MRAKNGLIAMLFITLTHFANAAGQNSNTQQFNRRISGTANVSQDNVAAMAMDANFTYVVQNLMPNPSTLPPYTSVSLSGALGVYDPGGYEHASVIVDRIDNATGAVVNLARIDVTGAIGGSTVTATAIARDGNTLYVTGYFSGQVKPNGVLANQNANSTDMFICTINTTSSGVTDWNQSSGDGDEFATCITNSLGTMYVGGYYTALAGVPVSSTWPTGGAGTTAPAVGITGQRNTFIATFSGSTLNCSKANGWMGLLNNSSSVQINGISTISASGVVVNYVTGSIIGSTTNPPMSGTTIGPIMFTARFVNTNFFAPPAPNTWSWAVLEGTCYTVGGAAPPLVNAGKAIIFGSSTELYVAGAAAYTSGSGPVGYHNGTSDAVVVKYTGITGVTPSRAYAIAIGTGYNDMANAIVNDGTNICVSGTMGCNDYSFSSGGSVVSTTATALAHAFVARYSTAGILDWEKTSDAYGNAAGSTAIACAGGCNLAIGGAYDRRQTWDVFQVDGATSPTTYRLYAHFMPVQKVVYTVPFTDPKYYLNNTSSTSRTATGATSYVWSFSTADHPGLSVSLSAPTSATNNTTLNFGGFNGSHFDLITTGTYTRGGTCTAVTRTRIFQNSSKKEDQYTGIGDVIGSENTLNIFPNPVSSQFTISYSFANNEPGIIQIVDITGRVLIEKPVQAQSDMQSFESRNWSNGIYIVNLLQGSEKIFSKQVLKQ